eukprot:scaffold13323_cov207-Alexandrium_tamarense.AAC.3
MPGAYSFHVGFGDDEGNVIVERWSAQEETIADESSALMLMNSLMTMISIWRGFSSYCLPRWRDHGMCFHWVWAVPRLSVFALGEKCALFPP